LKLSMQLEPCIGWSEASGEHSSSDKEL
jgi:hypothetical protein